MHRWPARTPTALILLLSLYSCVPRPTTAWLRAGADAFQRDARQQAYRPFLRSEELGITHCTLQGTVKGYPADLHVWLRLQPPLADSTNSTTLVKGFALLQPRRVGYGIPQRPGSPQIQQSRVVRHLGQVYLRSAYTGAEYPLYVTLRGRPVKYPLGTHMSSSWVLELWGELTLSQEDSMYSDLELRAEGFLWHCNILYQPHTMAHEPTTIVEQPWLTAAANLSSTAATRRLHGSPKHTIQAASPGHEGTACDGMQSKHGAWVDQTETLDSLARVHRQDSQGQSQGRDMQGRGPKRREARMADPGTEQTDTGSTGASQHFVHSNRRLAQTPAAARSQMHGTFRLAQAEDIDLDPITTIPNITTNTNTTITSMPTRQAQDPHDIRMQMLRKRNPKGGKKAKVETPKPFLGIPWGPYPFPFPGSTVLPPKTDAEIARAGNMTRADTFSVPDVWEITENDTRLEPVHKRAGTPRGDTGGVGDKTEVWVVLSPFYNISTHDYATLLWHHVLWHKQLGINKYVQYATERLYNFTQDPYIKTLIDDGKLTVVQYNDMPKHESSLYQPTHVDNYLMQVLIYNHAVLSLWGTNSLAILLDIDEYLITAQPMVAVQAFNACAPAGVSREDMAGMQIQRRVGVPGSPDQPPALPLNTTSTHTNTAASDLSLPAPITGGYLQSWLDVSPLDVEAGRMAHPLRGWSAALNTSDLVAHQDTKAMLDPNRVLSAHVHVFAALPGYTHTLSKVDCIRVVHVKDLFSRRSPGASQLQALSEDEWRQWWWPVWAMLDENTDDTQA